MKSYLLLVIGGGEHRTSNIEHRTSNIDVQRRKSQRLLGEREGATSSEKRRHGAELEALGVMGQLKNY
jgi:hypothetical protein